MSISPQPFESFHDSQDHTDNVISINEYKFRNNSKFALTQVPLAPLPNMDHREVIDHYIPGDRAMIISATARWVKEEIEKSQEVKDHLARVTVLLAKSRAVINDFSPSVRDILQTQVSDALGALLLSSEHHIGAIINPMRQYYGALSDDDLTLIGQIGFFQSIERFDLSERFEVLTFCSHRIKGAVLDEIQDAGSTITIPRGVLNLQRVVTRNPNILNEMSDEERRVTMLELAALASTKTLSLDRPTIGKDGSEMSLTDRLKDERAETIFLELEDEAVDIEIQMLVDELPYKLAEVIRMYYGIDPYDQSFNIYEIGLQLGVTESRASQLHTKALSLLRARLGF